MPFGESDVFSYVNMRKVVIACDSFKGSLTSAQANRACASAVRECFPEAEVCELAVGDGGEGTGEALMAVLGACEVMADAVDPLGRPIIARYHIGENGTTAIIEAASASGLPLLSLDERDPWAATSYGTGMLIADAIHHGCREIVLCVGGTATNDGGAGIMQALGMKFFDSEGELLGRGGHMLEQIAAVDASGLLPSSAGVRFVLFTDVDNVLCGPVGASCVFAPQKGASASLCARLDHGLANFAQVLADCGFRDVSAMAGSGAGGGIAGGMASVFGAEIRLGAAAVLDSLGFANVAENADLIITGEGCLDATTLHGKLPLSVLRASGNVPVAAFGGSVLCRSELLHAGFADAVAVKPAGMPLCEAMREGLASDLLYKSCKRFLERMHHTP